MGCPVCERRARAARARQKRFVNYCKKQKRAAKSIQEAFPDIIVTTKQRKPKHGRFASKITIWNCPYERSVEVIGMFANMCGGRLDPGTEFMWWTPNETKERMGNREPKRGYRWPHAANPG
jgi:hypothetical protein